MVTKLGDGGKRLANGLVVDLVEVTDARSSSGGGAVAGSIALLVLGDALGLKVAGATESSRGLDGVNVSVELLGQRVSRGTDDLVAGVLVVVDAVLGVEQRLGVADGDLNGHPVGGELGDGRLADARLSQPGLDLAEGLVRGGSVLGNLLLGQPLAVVGALVVGDVHQLVSEALDVALLKSNLELHQGGRGRGTNRLEARGDDNLLENGVGTEPGGRSGDCGSHPRNSDGLDRGEHLEFSLYQGYIVLKKGKK